MCAVFRQAVLITLCSSLLAGCGPYVNYRYDKDADFSRLKTYRWTLTPVTSSKSFDAYVRKAVDEQLAAKGYRKKAANGVDFMVGAAARAEVQLMTYRLDMGPRYDYPYCRRYRFRDWDHEWCYVTVPHEIGTLALYIIDPATKKVLWEGYAQDIIDDAVTPEQGQQKAYQFITGVLEKFPPR